MEMWHPLIGVLHGRGIHTMASTYLTASRQDSTGRVVCRGWLGWSSTCSTGSVTSGWTCLAFRGAACSLSRWPTRLPSVCVALCSRPHPRGCPGAWGRAGGAAGALIRLLGPRRYRDPDYLASGAGQLYGGAAFGLPEDHLAARLARPPSSRGYRHQIWALQGWNWLAAAAQPRTADSVLAGDDHRLVPVANGQILSRLIPHAHLVVVRGGGHLFLLQLVPAMARRFPILRREVVTRSRGSTRWPSRARRRCQPCPGSLAVSAHGVDLDRRRSAHPGDPALDKKRSRSAEVARTTQ